MRAFFIALALLIAAPATLHPAPIWPPQRVQQIKMYTIEVVITSKADGRSTRLAYHESFADESSAQNMRETVRGIFYEWVRNTYGLTREDVDEIFSVDVVVTSVTGASATRRAA